MFTMVSTELMIVREALERDPSNYGVGILHLATGRIVLRPFNDLRHRGGHVELVEEFEWPPDQCLGFIVARPGGESLMVNISHLNTQAGPLQMPTGTFRNILLTLRQCWAGMAASGIPG